MPIKSITAARKDSEKGKKWFAIAVGAIMLMSVAGFVFTLSPSGQGQSFRHNGIVFKQTPQGYYTAQISGIAFDFLYRPEDLSDIEVPARAIELLTGSRAARISYDLNSTLASEMAVLQFDIAKLLDARYSVFAEPAFTGENQQNRPVATCSNATSFVPVLLLQQANSTAVSIDTENPNCVAVSGPDSTGLLRAGERLNYELISGGAK